MAGFLADIKRRYSDFVSLALPSYREYISLRDEHRVAVIGSIASIALSIASASLLPTPYRVELSILVAVLGVLISSQRILSRISYAYEKRRGLAEELPFAVFMASVTAKTGLELVEALEFINLNDIGGSVFKHFTPLSKRLVNISRYVSIYEAMTSLTGIPRQVKKAFIDYVAGVAQGTGVETLRSLGIDMIREASRRASRTIELSAQSGLVIVMVMTTAPMMVLGVSSIAGAYVAMAVALLITISTPLIALAIPPLPYPLRPVPAGNTGYIYVLRGLSLALLTSLYILLYIPVFLPGLRPQWLVTSVWGVALSLLITGSISTMIFWGYVRSAGLVKDLLASAGRYVRVYRSLEGFDVDGILRGARLAAPWILYYIALSIRFLMERGELDHMVFTRFSDEIGDIISKNSERLITSLIPLAAALIQPVFLAQVMGMMAVEGIYQVLLSAVSSLSSSIIASKIFFGEAYNTLAPGLSVISLFLLMPRGW